MQTKYFAIPIVMGDQCSSISRVTLSHNSTGRPNERKSNLHCFKEIKYL